ncbi:hypothetical protein J6590_035031 [Homalodisca vitripennis]|nr:hypothetical protein J6590_035031 [Homalodisca vitripennis]
MAGNHQNDDPSGEIAAVHTKSRRIQKFRCARFSGMTLSADQSHVVDEAADMVSEHYRQCPLICARESIGF